MSVMYPLISDGEFAALYFEQSRKQARLMIFVGTGIFLLSMCLDMLTLGSTLNSAIIFGLSMVFSLYSWVLLKKLLTWETPSKLEQHLYFWLIAFLSLLICCHLSSLFLLPRDYLGHFFVDVWLCASVFFIVPLKVTKIAPVLMVYVVGEISLILMKNSLATSQIYYLMTLFFVSGMTAYHFAARLHFYRLRLFSAEKEMLHRASTDPLTGIANRREFLRISEVELQRHSRIGKPLSIILLDLDYFKQLSLNFGPQIGDIVLVEVSNRVKRATRNYDSLGRYSTEEFCVLLPEANEDIAIRVAERARACIVGIPVTASGREVKVSACVGVASLRAGDNLNSLLQRADESLKEAKLKAQQVSTSLFQPFA